MTCISAHSVYSSQCHERRAHNPSTDQQTPQPGDAQPIGVTSAGFQTTKASSFRSSAATKSLDSILVVVQASPRSAVADDFNPLDPFGALATILSSAFDSGWDATTTTEFDSTPTADTGADSPLFSLVTSTTDTPKVVSTRHQQPSSTTSSSQRFTLVTTSSSAPTPSSHRSSTSRSSLSYSSPSYSLVTSSRQSSSLRRKTTTTATPIFVPTPSSSTTEIPSSTSDLQSSSIVSTTSQAVEPVIATHSAAASVNRGLDRAAIAGAVVGGIAGFALIFAFVVFFLRWRKARRDRGDDDDDFYGTEAKHESMQGPFYPSRLSALGVPASRSHENHGAQGDGVGRPTSMNPYTHITSPVGQGAGGVPGPRVQRHQPGEASRAHFKMFSPPSAETLYGQSPVKRQEGLAKQFDGTHAAIYPTPNLTPSTAAFTGVSRKPLPLGARLREQDRQNNTGSPLPIGAGRPSTLFVTNPSPPTPSITSTPSGMSNARSSGAGTVIVSELPTMAVTPPSKVAEGNSPALNAYPGQSVLAATRAINGRLAPPAAYAPYRPRPRSRSRSRSQERQDGTPHVGLRRSKTFTESGSRRTSTASVDSKGQRRKSDPWDLA